MGILTARYENGEIKDCKPDTLIWLHEYRHKIQQDATGIFDILGLYFVPFSAFTLISYVFAWKEVLPYLKVFWLVWGFAYVWMELDAWIYSILAFLTKNLNKTGGKE